jgi:hypothetical protein
MSNQAVGSTSPCLARQRSKRRDPASAEDARELQRTKGFSCIGSPSRSPGIVRRAASPTRRMTVWGRRLNGGSREIADSDDHFGFSPRRETARRGM